MILRPERSKYFMRLTVQPSRRAMALLVSPLTAAAMMASRSIIGAADQIYSLRTTGQTLAMQKALLKAAGVERVFSEKIVALPPGDRNWSAPSISLRLATCC